MKIITDKSTFLSVIKKAAKIANGRAMMPIYNHVALSFDGKRCTLTASDSVRTYQEIFEAQGEPGQCTLEAVKLSRAVTNMKSGEIEITDKKIKQDRTNIKLESMSYDSFPIPDLEKSESCGIDSADLVHAISVISHALPVKDVRIMLNGVHLTKGYAVATDGMRMAYIESKYDGPDVIIPSETIRQFPEIDGAVSVSSNQLIIKGANAIFSTGLVDAKFPDWQRIIPKDFNINLKANSGDLLSAIKTAQIGADMVRFNITKDTAILKNEGAETECNVVSTGDIEIGFMTHFLIDAINAANSSDLDIKMGDGKACLINDFFIVMPVRL